MKISTSEYIVRETMISLKRNSWMSFASIGTVAVSLFVLGMFLILVVNMKDQMFIMIWESYFIPFMESMILFILINLDLV